MLSLSERKPLAHGPADFVPKLGLQLTISQFLAWPHPLFICLNPPLLFFINKVVNLPTNLSSYFSPKNNPVRLVGLTRVWLAQRPQPTFIPEVRLQLTAPGLVP